MRPPLITGITGQDGRYLAEALRGRKYHVFGLVTGQANPRGEELREELPFVELVGGDLQDFSSLISAVDYSAPDEVYNLGAISFVPLSFKQPELTTNVIGLGVLRLLEAIRLASGGNGAIKFYQASSREMSGKVRESPQDELTPFYPKAGMVQQRSSAIRSL
jgi:GDPmannose 4,6-dehydratase